MGRSSGTVRFVLVGLGARLGLEGRTLQVAALVTAAGLAVIGFLVAFEFTGISSDHVTVEGAAACRPDVVLRRPDGVSLPLRVCFYRFRRERRCWARIDGKYVDVTAQVRKFVAAGYNQSQRPACLG